ncbi:universal stress protein [Actinacidiphila acidipaludis]|uniref:Universal stress protein n=1 Tax=Actinacidiphila acidipaludis TaxID=2873382 RepID=A0ABS7PZD6_9ACTN|nr:universal stress protein [Streptomyces acidipaludis]MBY8876247.1 universal stress protein [Streptomyces acidipaludis]
MNAPLIVGVDGSDASLRAIDWAVAEAARHDVPVRLVHGSLWERYETVKPAFGTAPSAGHLMAEHIVASAAERAARIAPDLKVTTELVSSDPGMALLRAAEAAFAVVVGTRGRGAISGMLLGSTGLEVAAYATCPVIVVRGEPDNSGDESGRIALGVGGPGESAAAIEFAFREAEVREADLLAVHAWHRPAHELPGTAHVSGDGSDHDEHEAERALGGALLATAQAYPKVTVQTRVPEGRAHTALLEAAATSDLLVVGARRPRGSIGMQLGLANHTVLHHAACPVAVVPQRS